MNNSATDVPQDGPPLGLGLSELLGPLLERWYCVNRIGVAILCADKKDAGINALNCDAAYPAYAPHRFVLLGDVAAERDRWISIAQEVDYGIAHGWPRETLDRLQRMRAAMLDRGPNVRAKQEPTA